MVTVYDMTSGTLRQELEADKKPARPVQTAELRLDTDYDYSPTPALQEIAWNQADTDKSAAHLIAGLNVDTFISRMK